MKITKLASLLLLGLLLAGRPSQAQLWQPAKPLSADYLTWSARRRLQASDFQFRARAHSNLKGCVGNFGLLTRGNTLELLSKKCNALVQNVLYRAGSYLDSADQRTVALQLLYLQTLWDIDEVAARRLRQTLRGSAKRTLLWGRPDLNDPMQAAYEAASKRQLQYTDETNYGLYLDKQAEWEKRLATELAELQAYALPEE
jgi:hypothetical protein